MIAHRGDSASAPEQTLAAFRRAVELGADMIEADVRRTRDGRLVMLHDANVDRTTDGRGPVDSFAFDDLRRLDAGSWFSPGFAGERIPALDELFELAADSGIALCLEAKGESAAECTWVACAVARELEKRGRLAMDVVACFDHPALAECARSVPGVRLAPDRLPERGASIPRLVVEQATSIGAQIVQHHHLDLTAATVEEAHAAGVAIWAWPPETLPEVGRLLELHVDGVMGDDVALIQSTL